MTRFYLIFLFLPLIGTTLFPQKVMAQCQFEGEVVEFTCGKIVLNYATFQMLAPVGDELDTIAEGTIVNFSFDPSNEPSYCPQFPNNVDLTCLETISLPSGSCDATFSHTENFDAGPTVVLEPVIINPDLNYYWTFGDGEISTEMQPVHTYDVQDMYQVCLQLSSDYCTGSTVCMEIDLNECHAEFAHETAIDGEVQFINFSTGNYSQWEWKMGDGSIFTNEEVTSHTYNGVDIYTACLTVWNDNGCSSEYCDYIFTGSGDVCDFTDCVLPGDTDADQAANVYDLLPIGVAYGAEGPPRSNDDVSADITWTPQYSPDWGLETISGLDYKHIDCNGDGIIYEEDLEVIAANYFAPGDVFMVTAPGEPYFYLEFDWDTVVITDNTPPFITLEADLMAGLPGSPLENLRGFALQMDYPEDMVLEDGVEVDYNDNSFFGSSNSILQMDKDRFDEGVMDVAFTRKSLSVDGFGKVAVLKFVIIADAIPRSTTATPFTIDVNGAVAVNEEGAQLTLDQPGLPATVIIVNKMTTATEEELLARQVSVFPNPATDKVQVSIDQLSGQRLEAFNALGQMVREQPIKSQQAEVDVSGWTEGVYLLHVHTEEGVVKKRLVVK